MLRQALITRFLCAAALFGLAAIDVGPAHAQGTPAILIDGNAVVTGFSGTQPPLPDAASVPDQTIIDLNGPSARIVDLQSPGAPPQAQLLTAPKPFTVFASQVGQVFAVALDNATPPNIYLAATSSYGLPIVAPAPGGFTRAKAGGPNVSFMSGLFGPAELGGGPGSVWRVDGVTGAVQLFTNVTLDGVANSGPALGGLAFDAGSGTLFAADRETGMIHRFDLSGRERGRFDHGVQGRMAAGLPPVPYDPSTRLDIGNPAFRPDNPATWGYAPLERLVYGLAVRGGRLYYAVADGLQIWSVAISPDGTFGADPHVEIQVSPWDGGSEISKITFDNPGRMLLAERTAPTGAYDFAALAKSGVGRVLRYRNVTPPAGGATVWAPDPDEYAIGFPDELRNANGGIAIGYGYTPNGQIDHVACSAFLWSTGEQLRNAMDPALIARLAAGGPAIVNGLQGNALGLVRPANVPPLQTYFVDYDDSFRDDAARGHMGDIAIPRVCGQALGPLPLAVPFGLIIEGGGECVRGEYRLRDGRCCPREYVRDGRCLPPPNFCPPDTIRLPDGQCCDRRYVRDGRCLPPNTCPPGTIRLPDGQCCDREYVRDGRCLPPNTCPPGTIKLPNGQCCDRENVRDGRCLPPNTCPPGTIRLPDGQCCDRENVRDGRCLPPNTCPPGTIKLPNGQCCDRANVRDGRCLPPPQNTCPPGQIQLPNGQCCDRANVRDGHCLPPPQNTCPRGQTMLSNGKCCPTQNVHDGQCVQILRKRPGGRRYKVEDQDEPVRQRPSFHLHIPSGVIEHPRTPEPPSRGSGGRGGIMLPHSTGNPTGNPIGNPNRTLR
ncbi:MAG TPA: hypothetical protein VIY51_06840 [Xanthobacteraceae bacterium]